MTLIVSTMSANLASLPLLHEHKVLTAPRTLMVCYRRANLASLLYYHAPQKSACAHATHELLVPGVGQGDRGGKAGGGQTLAQPHVVGSLVLMAQAVRPVGELQRGQPHGRDGPRAERGAAGQQGTLLPETQLGDDALMSHGALPTRPPAPSCRTWP